VADDAYINLELIKINLAEVGVNENVTYCSDGSIAIAAALDFLRAGLNEWHDRPIRPITLMLLDFQMPMKTGLQVIEQVRNFCEAHQDKIISPKFVILTAFATKAFKEHLSSIDIDCCFEKPMKKVDLKILLQTLTVSEAAYR
jgi:CheY-like chemotaxis protein